MALYVIRSEAGPVKIGISADPIRRLAQIIYGQPFTATLEHTREVDRELHTEAAVHRELAEYHRRAEWFDVSVERAVEAIDVVLERMSKPRRRKKRPAWMKADPAPGMGYDEYL